MSTGVEGAAAPPDDDARVVAGEAEAPAYTVDRARAILSRIVERVGGIPAVQTLLQVFDAYDGVGGGLTAAGLAYAALFALIPGLLLVLSVVGVVIDDPVIRDQIVEAIGTAFPPLADVAQAAFEQVSAGAVPTGIVAFAGLLWGSSRFYSSLDYSFTKIFHTTRRRNEVERSLRGLLVSALFIGLPIVLVIVGSGLALVASLAPALFEPKGMLGSLLEIATPLVTLVVFVGGLMVVFRFVPTVRPPMRSLALPAVIAGTVLAVFTQLFAFIAPRMLGWAALFGALVTVFALLVWLSISFNVLLFAACWTRVRWTAAVAAAAVADDVAAAAAEVPAAEVPAAEVPAADNRA